MLMMNDDKTELFIFALQHRDDAFKWLNINISNTSAPVVKVLLCMDFLLKQPNNKYLDKFSSFFITIPPSEYCYGYYYMNSTSFFICP